MFELKLIFGETNNASTINKAKITNADLIYLFNMGDCAFLLINDSIVVSL